MLEERYFGRCALYDVIIIGLGVMGSATAWQAARAGLSVLGLDQFETGHHRASSHGQTRVIRRVYGEGDIYMPLLGRAYALWDEIAGAAGEDFLIRTGGLDIGPTDSPLLQTALATAHTWRIDHDYLTAPDICARWPAFRLPDHYAAVFAPQSGLLRSDAANAWIRGAAADAGAALRWNTPVSRWRREGDSYVVETANGAERARKLVIAAGAWTGMLVPELDAGLTVERQVVAWFEPRTDLSTLPVFQVDPEDGMRPYVMPPLDGAGLKIGVYGHLGERGSVMRQGRGPDAADEALLRANVERWLPGTIGKTELMMECRFTRTRDDRFIIGPLPDDPGVILLSPCSGHGYKFAPAIGEAATDLVLERHPRIDLGPFAVERACRSRSRIASRPG